MILHIIIYTVLLVLLGLSWFLLFRSLAKSRNYEEFYEASLDDVDAVMIVLDELIYRRQLLSDDPDVRKVYKTISIFRDVLIGYADARNERNDKTKEKEKR